MSFAVIDFIVDLMWGGSEVYLAKRRRKQNQESEEPEEIVNRVNRQDGGPTDNDKRELVNGGLANRDGIARIIGNKTV